MLALAGRIGQASAPALAAAVTASLERSNPLTVIDFEHVDYVSSAGLAVMTNAVELASARSGRLALASLCEPVRITFDLAGLLADLQVESSRAEAIARVKS